MTLARSPEKIRSLHVITFSGPHGSGKTTLLNDLKQSLQAAGERVFTTESCSTRLFERIRSGGVRLPDSLSQPETYDDIDRLGLRAFFQMKLPDSLSLEVELALRRLRRSRLSATLLVDRWFPDILAYTMVESSDTKLHRSVQDLCRSRASLLMDEFDAAAHVFSVTNLYVSQRSVTWGKSRAQRLKFRATCDPMRWESVCLANWRRAGGMARYHTVTKSDRRERVAEILRLIGGDKPEVRR